MAATRALVTGPLTVNVIVSDRQGKLNQDGPGAGPQERIKVAQSAHEESITELCREALRSRRSRLGELMPVCCLLMEAAAAKEI
jgi:hypothetical protein